MTLIEIRSIELTDESRKGLEELLAPKGELFREVALELIPQIHDRIHQKGLAADGTEIGVYTDSYMRVRQGTVKHRQNATDVKTKKTFSTVERSRPKYNRSSDPQVVLSLTRQMENDYAVLPGEIGWGVGFNNPHNFNKAFWNNTRYGKIIYDLTDEELKFAVHLTETLITERSASI